MKENYYRVVVKQDTRLAHLYYTSKSIYDLILFLSDNTNFLYSLEKIEHITRLPKNAFLNSTVK